VSDNNLTLQRPRLHQKLKPILDGNPPTSLHHHRMPNGIPPTLKPRILRLNHTPPPSPPYTPLSPRHISIRPHCLDDLVFLRAGKDLGNIGEEPVHLIWGMDHDAGVHEGEGDFHTPTPIGARYQGEEATF
jgi:hypothetical protein